MIRVIYKNKEFEVSEISNLPLYQLACQILMASGYYNDMEILKYLAIYMKIKENRLFISYMQDAVGRIRRIDIPVVLFTGVAVLSIKRAGWASLEHSNSEITETLCFQNGKLVKIEDPYKWLQCGNFQLYRNMVDKEVLITILEAEGYSCQPKRVVLEQKNSLCNL